MICSQSHWLVPSCFQKQTGHLYSPTKSWFSYVYSDVLGFKTPTLCSLRVEIPGQPWGRPKFEHRSMSHTQMTALKTYDLSSQAQWIKKNCFQLAQKQLQPPKSSWGILFGRKDERLLKRDEVEWIPLFEGTIRTYHGFSIEILRLVCVCAQMFRFVFFWFVFFWHSLLVFVVVANVFTYSQFFLRY